jgi:hypothetical protein
MTMPAFEPVAPCEHPASALRFRVTSKGARMFARQCLKCGHSVSNWIKAETIDPAERAAAQPFNDDLRESWRASIMNAYAARWMDEKTRRDCEWGIEYTRYINSPEWEGRRRKVLERAGKKGLTLPTCEACGDRPASEVHHKTYENFGNEPLWDLAAVCEWCHNELHAANKG